ncbi:hypothetical protein IQ270_17335 [Microcoleus sp. LEGE 07076]|uniref:hypothetical protein n=1 Tax=Microcoleus sp. LEGE 07076 TaxID=915322 RepID=UPI0018823E32|nr:hypothetical protein [Microcoleus sp. LEGE 07076]MBE9186396.1 hypothetical protein [Microcoleus sp. LEGE 07076]
MHGCLSWQVKIRSTHKRAFGILIVTACLALFDSECNVAFDRITCTLCPRIPATELTGNIPDVGTRTAWFLHSDLLVC